MSRTGRRYILRAAAAVAVAALIAIYFIFDPQEGFFPRCPSRMITGLNCPGCGSQRALHALLHGDVAQAVKYNLLMVAMLPVMGVLTAAEVLRDRYPRFYNAANSRTLCIILLAAVIIWGVVRNLPAVQSFLR